MWLLGSVVGAFALVASLRRLEARRRWRAPGLSKREIVRRGWDER
jgi:hypothetical protein